MIKIAITVKNDHCSYTEHYEQTVLLLDPDDELLKDMIEGTIKRFGQPVEDVKVKTKMEV